MAIKKWIFIWLILLGFGVVIAFLVEKIIGDRPERTLAKSFLLSNLTITKKFGMPITVTYIREGTSLEFHSDRNEGKYRFKIKGSRESGTVKVQWESNGKGENFKVERIELLRNEGTPEVLWQ